MNEKSDAMFELTCLKKRHTEQDVRACVCVPRFDSE